LARGRPPPSARALRNRWEREDEKKEIKGGKMKKEPYSTTPQKSGSTSVRNHVPGHYNKRRKEKKEKKKNKGGGPTTTVHLSLHPRHPKKTEEKERREPDLPSPIHISTFGCTLSPGGKGGGRETRRKKKESLNAPVPKEKGKIKKTKEKEKGGGTDRC